MAGNTREEQMKIKRKIRRTWRQFLEKLNLPYKLKIEPLRGYTWCEYDHLLFEASFQVLVNYIELGRPEEIIDWDADDRHREAWRKIKGLYNWYKLERPNRQDIMEDVEYPEMEFTPIEGSDLLRLDFKHKTEWAKTIWEDSIKKSMDLEWKWYCEDTEKMCELARIREFLWT